MGVTIHNKLGQKKHLVKQTLDKAQKYAEHVQKQDNLDLNIEVRRTNDYELLIDMAGCETLCFSFESARSINEDNAGEWKYARSVLTGDGKKNVEEGYEIDTYPQNEQYYSAGSTKTQYGKNIITHKLVADLIKLVASYCFLVEVSDEGEYYHSGDLGDSIASIKKNGALIDSLLVKLTQVGFKEENIIKGGNTVIGK